MAKVRDEAWVTVALDSASAHAAAVLAQSLQQCGTTRTIVAVIGKNVSLPERNILGNTCDVICFPETFPYGVGLSEEEKAKLFAISMPFLKRVVFLSAFHLILENVDLLFETLDLPRMERKRVCWSDIRNSSLLVYSTCPEISTFLNTHFRQDAQAPLLEETSLPGTFCGDKKCFKRLFSLEKGLCYKELLGTKMVEFVDISRNGTMFKQQLMDFGSVKGTTFEKGNKCIGMLIVESMTALVIGKWLELYDNLHVSPVSLGNTVSNNYFDNEPIAIIGMGCRFPGANNLSEYWDLLVEGRDLMSSPPKERWTEDRWIHRFDESTWDTLGGFLSVPVDEFDAKFFGMSPKDAEWMDPQTRLLHEVLWEALENSGIDPTKLRGTHTGIFTGSWTNDYKLVAENSEYSDRLKDYMGSGHGPAAARLSFFLGVTGPSIAAESGCSSAMVALDIAMQRLRTGKCKLAIAGGVNLLVRPFTRETMKAVLSPTGKCHTFSTKADGFGRSEGCGLLVLKRLSNALQDRDHIWGIVRGSAITQEGISDSITRPTVECESLAMTLALQDANVDPGQVDYVEAHGTGTKVGDPLEMAAITKAYYAENRSSPLLVGSVKTNMGHTESCSGVAGIIKVVLAMHHETIPRHLNLEEVNSEINLAAIPAIIPTENYPWPKREEHCPRIAGVSSFGITGADAHVIIEEPPRSYPSKFSLGMERPLHLMKITGKTEKALDELHNGYVAVLEQCSNAPCSFADVAFSGNAGRPDFQFREIVIADDFDGAIQKMQSGQHVRAECDLSVERKVCFLFPGQGSQYHGMGQKLYSTSPVFRVNFDECERILKKNYNFSVLPFILSEADNTADKGERTLISQTSIFCVEYCLFKLWESWGITPDFVLGHSLGEFSACVAAGILNLADGLKLVVERSKLIDALPHGKMLAMQANREWVENVLKNNRFSVDIAAVNSDTQVVAAGDVEGIDHLLEHCKTNGVKATILASAHPFHSRFMDPILERIREVANSMKNNSSEITEGPKYISGLKGTLVPASSIDADYWVSHTRNSVQFLTACQNLKEMEIADYLEIGAAPILSSFVIQSVPNATCLPSLRKGVDDWNSILLSLGKLYLLGYDISWEGFDAPYPRMKTPILPSYPFERKSYWMPGQKTEHQKHQSRVHPLVGSCLGSASSQKIFQNDLWLENVPYINEHKIGTRVIYPGAAFLEMALTAAKLSDGSSGTIWNKLSKVGPAITLENFSISTPLEIRQNAGVRLQMVVEPRTVDGIKQIGIYSEAPSDVDIDRRWVLHAGSSHTSTQALTDNPINWSPENLQQKMSVSSPVPSGDFYDCLNKVEFKFGEHFRSISHFWFLNETETLAEVAVPEDYEQYLVHPILLDAVIQAGMASEDPTTVALRLPVKISRCTLFPVRDPSKTTFTNSLLIYTTKQDTGCSGYLLTKDFQPLVYLEGVQVFQTTLANFECVLMDQVQRLPNILEEVWYPLNKGQDSSAEIYPPLLSSIDIEYSPEGETLMDQYGAMGSNAMNRLVYLYVVTALDKIGFGPHLFSGKTGVKTKTLCEVLGIQGVGYAQLMHIYLMWIQEVTAALEWNPSLGTWRQTKDFDLPVLEASAEISQIIQGLRDAPWLKLAKMSKHIANQLPDILTGKVDILSLLFPTTSSPDQSCTAESFYINAPDRLDTMQHCKATFGQILKDRAPGPLRILEVGAGTGSLTRELLPFFKKFGGDQLEYYYTDVSRGLLVNAKPLVKEYEDNVVFALFDIDSPPLEQGISVNYFDVVIALNVFHIAKDLTLSMAHVRQLLKPQGILYFIETVDLNKWIAFVFGLVEGYWNFRDYHLRPHYCCIDVPTWEKVLLNTGFLSTRAYNTGGGHCCVVAQATSVTVPMLPRRHADVKQSNAKSWMVFVPTRVEKIRQALDTLSRFNSVTAIFQSAEQLKIYQESSTNDVNCVDATADNTGDLGSLLGALSADVIVFAWGVDVSRRDPLPLASQFLQVVKYIRQRESPPLLYVLTEGVYPVTTGGLVYNPEAAVLHAMAKAMKGEDPNLFIRCIDFEHDPVREDGPEAVARFTHNLLYELSMNKQSSSKESKRFMVAYRGNSRFKPKLCKRKMHLKQNQLPLPREMTHYQLVLPSTKRIQDLQFEALYLDGSLGEDEVNIEVHAYALNFRDIFAVTKPTVEFDSINTVGVDVAGSVIRVGRRVATEGVLAVGDRVFGINLSDAPLCSSLVIPADCVLKVPAHLSMEEASTIPAVFSTAYHSLIEVAQMSQEDTVLLHTASGGVGLAAIQLCHHVGATVIATAGSPRKRAFLKTLGVRHVFDSRSLTYAQDIMEVTSGAGVNIVLNSLTGPGFKEASLSVCAKHARFIEMSKMSIWTTAEVKQLRPDVKYTVVNVAGMNGKEVSLLMEKLEEYLRKRIVRPLPYVKYSVVNIRQALEYFQEAKHIGKIVVSMQPLHPEEDRPCNLFNGDSTYLITGGLGGIGYEVCKWMLERGATDLVLMGRSPPPPPIAASIEELRGKGFNVEIFLGDVADENVCRDLFKRISETDKPLRGIMHSAGVTRDGLYADQNEDSFRVTFRPKVNGTWNLHNMSMSLSLDHFVLFSSLSALMGNYGQSNHSAANSFLDSFAHYRRSFGLPVTSINWGQWAQVGIAKDLSLPAILPVSIKRMLKSLEAVMGVPTTQVVIADLTTMQEMTVLCGIAQGYVDESAFIGASIEQGETSKETGMSTEKFWETFKNLEETTPQVAFLEEVMTFLIKITLGVGLNEGMDPKASIASLGVDSLVMMELRNKVQLVLGSEYHVSADAIKSNKSIKNISEDLHYLVSNDAERLQSKRVGNLKSLLERDCSLPESIAVHGKPTCRPSKMSTVLVTGTTGFLGGHVLSVLCTEKYKGVEGIVCLIRTLKDPQELLPKTQWSEENGRYLDKIRCLEGDFTRPNLGLSEEVYGELCASVDGVIHVAAKTNHVEPYDDDGVDVVRTVNVIGTLNLLKFAAETKVKHFHFASSFWSSGLFQENSDTLPNCWPGPEMAGWTAENDITGYFASKFVCEVLLEQAISRGIPCKAFRFPAITGNSVTGVVNYKDNHFIQRLATVLQVKAISDLPMPLNHLPVDVCAEVSLQIFFHDEAPSDIYYVVHPRPLLEQHFKEIAQNDFGVSVDTVSHVEFARRIQETSTPLDLLLELYSNTDRLTNMFSVTCLKNYITPGKSDMTGKVKVYLPEFGDNLESPLEYIRRDLKYAASKRLFPDILKFIK